MSGPLRALLERPIAERDRKRLFALAALVMLATAAALTLTRPDDPHGRGASRTVARVALAPGSWSPIRATASVPAQVLIAGRRFVAGYLPYLYGRRSGSSIAAASGALRRQLARTAPRVSPQLRRRHPRVVHLGGHRLASAGQWALTASVSDGVVRYALQLVVTENHGTPPVVVALGED